MKPLVIAHRGASGDAPENTLKAFELSLRHGADGVEFDVFLTRDKQVVVTHDENAERLTGTNQWVRKSSLKELLLLNYGQNERIPTLEQVFELGAKTWGVINIEIKTTGTFTDGIEAELVKLIRKWDLIERVYVSSFNPFHLLRLRAIEPKIKRGYLVWQEHWLNRQTLPIRICDPASINLDHTWCTDERLRKYGSIGPKIWLWTVNELDDMKRWISKGGIGAIITNYPARLKALLEEGS